MAGRLGCGGGPRLFLFSPLGGCEALLLQEQERDQRQERMPVQTPPRAALEVIEAEFFLHLLVRLLADPARLDGRGELPHCRLGRQIGEIILALARRAVLADQPDLVPGQMLTGAAVQAHCRSIGDPHAKRRKARPQRALGAVPPLVPCRQMI